MKLVRVPIARYRKLKRLRELAEQCVRAEVYARMAPIAWPEYGEAFKTKLDTEAEIRELLFGTSCIAELAKEFGMVHRRKKKIKIKKKKGKKHGTARDNKLRKSKKVHHKFV